MTRSLLFGLAWVLALLGAYLIFQTKFEKIRPLLKRGWLYVLIVAALTRLIPNFVLPVGARFDIESYQIVSGLVLQNEDVYTNPEADNRHPYLPLQMYWMALSKWISEATHLPYVQIVRLLPIMADITIAILLYFQVRKLTTEQDGLMAGLLYALNPVSVMVSAYHGQFDAIPVLFILLSFKFLSRSAFLSGGSLGMGILSKSWPVLAIPSLLKGIDQGQKKAQFLVTTLAVPMLGVGVYALVFGAQPVLVFFKAVSYNRGIGIWGYTYLIFILTEFGSKFAPVFNWFINYARYITLGFLVLVWVYRGRREDPKTSFLTILVAFFALTHAFSIQYLMWLVPFALLNQDYKWLSRYIIAASSYMILAYHTLILDMRIDQLLPWPQADLLIIIPAGLPAWLVTIGWLIYRLSNALHPEINPIDGIQPEVITNQLK